MNSISLTRAPNLVPFTVFCYVLIGIINIQGVNYPIRILQYPFQLYLPGPYTPINGLYYIPRAIN